MRERMVAMLSQYTTRKGPSVRYIGVMVEPTFRETMATVSRPRPDALAQMQRDRRALRLALKQLTRSRCVGGERPYRMTRRGV